MAQSWVALESSRFRSLPIDDAQSTTAAAYLERVRADHRTRKDQKSEIDVRRIVEDRRGNARAVVFYAGQNDDASGMRPAWLADSKIHSPFFASTGDALDRLSILAKKNNWLILFKPHPMCESDAGSIREEDHVATVAGANVFECIDASDATVTVLSQVGYLSLIHSKPCVLLGRMQLSGKGCLYEISGAEDTEAAVCEAIKHGFSADQKEMWRLHVAQLLKHYLFGFDADIVELLGRDENLAADLLMGHAKAKKPEFVASRWGGDLLENGRSRRIRLFYFVSKSVERPLRRVLKRLPNSVQSGVRRMFGM